VHVFIDGLTVGKAGGGGGRRPGGVLGRVVR
jgi:hypothetical protein